MKKSLLLFIPLILMLVAAGGFAEKAKKVSPAKTSSAKEKPEETNKKEQPKPNRTALTPAQVSPKQDQPPAVIKPDIPYQIEFLPAPFAPLTGEEINWQVISQGGTDGGSASYRVAGTVAQMAVGSGSSGSYQLLQGFWQEFVEGFLLGDVNADGIIDLGDVLYLISYLYKGGPAPDPLEVGDCDCDDLVDLGDLLFLISYLYKGGPPPEC
jgi:hypothetical protein